MWLRFLTLSEYSCHLACVCVEVVYILCNKRTCMSTWYVVFHTRIYSSGVGSTWFHSADVLSPNIVRYVGSDRKYKVVLDVMVWYMSGTMMTQCK